VLACSLLDRRFEGELAEACAPHHYNLGLLPYGPLVRTPALLAIMNAKRACDMACV
jgi:aryl-alcohol dehydrogenase-like predicted oxidoreductase